MQHGADAPTACAQRLLPLCTDRTVSGETPNPPAGRPHGSAATSAPGLPDRLRIAIPNVALLCFHSACADLRPK